MFLNSNLILFHTCFKPNFDLECLMSHPLRDVEGFRISSIENENENEEVVSVV